MNLADAKKVVATYLTGGRVSHAALREACDAIRADEEYIKYLKSEFGLSDDWSTGCEVFLSHLGEFTEMSPRQRQREFPELELHLHACRLCRRRYWNVKPIWLAEAADVLRERMGASRSRLAERIRLLVEQGGKLIEQGFGPPPIEQEPVAVTMSGQSEAQRVEWVLADTDAGCTVRMTVFRDSSRHTRIICSIESETADIKPGSSQIEVRSEETGSLQLAGRLSDFESEGIFIDFGSWIVRLEAELNGERRTWELPLEVVRA